MIDRSVERIATCQCGQLQVACWGDPVRISVYEARQHPRVRIVGEGIEHSD